MDRELLAFLLGVSLTLILTTPQVRLVLLHAFGLIARLGVELSAEGAETTYENVDVKLLNTCEPSSEWMNMGWWVARTGQPSGDGRAPLIQPERASPSTQQTTFPAACEALARTLYAECGLQERSDSAVKLADRQPAADVLDLGHGTGESLLLLLRHYRVSRLDGVTLARREASTATRRIARVLKGDGDSSRLGDVPINVRHGDALAYLRSTEPSETPADQGVTRYDFIFALDCAYHFQGSRAEFFQAAFKRLKPGGTLGLFDIFASTPYPATTGKDIRARHWFHPEVHLRPPSRAAFTFAQSIKLKAFSLLVRAPRDNLCSFTTYHELLGAAGFTDVNVTDVSSAVFPGFSHFLTSLSQQRWRGQAVSWSMKHSMAAFGNFVQDWARGGDVGLLRGGLVVARKPIVSQT
ncbi:unnamed protein product [Parajaminaea phylloscopi]